MNIAILDDYQNVAMKVADWTVLPPSVHVQPFHDHVADLDSLVERIRSFEVICLMRERTPFQRESFERLPNLKLLVTSGMRNAAIDFQAATDHGVMVCGTRSLGSPTAELTWGLILGLLRSIPFEDRAIREGHWQSTVGIGLEGKTLGILGMGRLGAQVARVGLAFSMRVVAWSQNLTRERAEECGAELVSKEDLFRQADIVSIHLQLSGRTQGLVGSRELRLMKPSAYLVNTSRGPIVDEMALLSALQSQRIAGAALDVYSQEPLPYGTPITRQDNVVLTPHLGYVTREGYQRFYGDMVEDVQAYLKGQPVRVLNPEAAS